jgi:hypothetical protein
MGSIWVKNFVGGLDRRRLGETTPGGTLLVAKDGHINRGGEFEKRAAFVETFELPAGTIGMAATGDRFYVFGSAAAPAGLPAGVFYQRLQAPVGTPDLARIISWDTFGGKLYVIAQFDDGEIYHFYDGTNVTDWEDGYLGTDLASNSDVAARFADLLSAVPGYTASAVGAVVTLQGPVGVDFTIAKSTTDGGGTNDQDLTLATTQTAIVPVTGASEVLASASFTINYVLNLGSTTSFSNLRVNGVAITDGASFPNGLFGGNPTGMAQAIVDAVNSHTSSPNYTASRSGKTVTIRAVAGSGATPNGFDVRYNHDNSRINVTPEDGAGNCEMAGGVTAVAAVAGRAKKVTITVSGTFEVGDEYTVTLNGTDYVVSTSFGLTTTSVKTIKDKAYVTAGSYLVFSAVGDATAWDAMTDTGAGSINMATQASQSEQVYGVVPYDRNAAVFAERTVQIWLLDPDPENNSQVQVLPNTGTRASRSITNFGDADVFYLDLTGIRSLRARNSSNAAFASDVGNAVDPLLLEHLADLTQEERDRAIGIIEPRDGRFWLAVKDKIFVFSYFAGSKVSAWSTYEPGFDVEDMCLFERRIYLRSGDTIYTYGGTGETLEYDATEAEAWLPYLDAEAPALKKQLQGYDAAVRGQWEVRCGMDPRNEEVSDLLGVLTETTYTLERLGAQGSSTHFSFRFKSQGTGPRILSALVIHYDADEKPE